MENSSVTVATSQLAPGTIVNGDIEISPRNRITAPKERRSMIVMSWASVTVSPDVSVTRQLTRPVKFCRLSGIASRLSVFPVVIDARGVAEVGPAVVRLGFSLV